MTVSAPGAAPGASSSRRALLAAAGATAAGAALAACSTRRSKPPPANSPGVRKSELRADVGILNSVLDLEHRSIVAYTAGLPLLGGAAHAAAQRFLIHELAHAAELSALVHEGGGKPHVPSPSYDLGHPAGARDVLALLHAIERASIAAYLDSLPRLSRGIVRSTVASILANEAEHISVLRASLGNPGVPSAFVTAGE